MKLSDKQRGLIGGIVDLAVDSKLEEQGLGTREEFLTAFPINGDAYVDGLVEAITDDIEAALRGEGSAEQVKAPDAGDEAALIAEERAYQDAESRFGGGL